MFRQHRNFIFLILAVAVPAFFLARHIWPLPVQPPQELELFLQFTTAVEALMLGAGVAFVAFVLKKHKVRTRKFGTLDWATFISISWILLSGYPHDNSHLVHGVEDLHGLVFIEIFFHGTLALAAIVIALYWMNKVHIND